MAYVLSHMRHCWDTIRSGWSTIAVEHLSQEVDQELSEEATIIYTRPVRNRISELNWIFSFLRPLFR
jgi:hypothetical protein